MMIKNIISILFQKFIPVLFCIFVLNNGYSAVYEFQASDSSTEEGNNRWSDKALWTSYPESTEVGDTVQLSGENKNSIVYLDKDITLGELKLKNISEFASPLPDVYFLTLDNGDQPALIEVYGNNTKIGVPLIVADSLKLQGTHTPLLTNSKSEIHGDLIMAVNSLYIYYPSTLSEDSKIIFEGQNDRNLHLGNATDKPVIIKNEIVLSDVSESPNRIINNTRLTLNLEGTISGNANLVLSSEKPETNEAIAIILSGKNTSLGETILQTNTIFDSIANFGDGSIITDKNPVTITFSEGNSSDLTKDRTQQTPRSVVFNTDTTLNVRINNVVFSNPILGNAKLIKMGEGELDLNANNEFTGVIVDEGTLRISQNGALGSQESFLEIHNGASLEVDENILIKLKNIATQENTTLIFHLKSVQDQPILKTTEATNIHPNTVIEIKSKSKLIPGTYLLLQSATPFSENLKNLTLKSENRGSLKVTENNLIYIVE